jgi:osmotically-inducible protein OsmY
VATQAEADKAKAVAKSVKGVKDVNSRLVIKAQKGESHKGD